MELTTHAKRIAAAKDAGTLGPSPQVPEVRDADEIARSVAEAQAALAQAGETGAFRADPYRLVLNGLSLVLGVFPRLVRRLEQAATDPKPPLTEAERAELRREMTEAVRAAALTGAKQSAVGLARSMDRRASLYVGLALGAAFLLGSGMTYAACLHSGFGSFNRSVQVANAWRDLQAANPDPFPAIQRAEIVRDTATGGRYYRCLSLWASFPGTPGKQ